MYTRYTHDGHEVTKDGMVLEQAIDPQEKTAAEYCRDFPRIVFWIEQELGRAISTLTHLTLDAEMVEVPPQGMWKRFEPGRHVYVTAQFTDGFRQILTLKNGELAYIPHKPDKTSEDDSAEIKPATKPRKGSNG